MRMPGASRSSTGRQRIMASLMACAPWLPPKTNSVGVPPRLGGISKKAWRTGTPVTSAWRKYFAVSSKWTAAAETNFATMRLANPGHHVGLEGQRRNVLEDGRQHCRAGGVSADADDYVGSEFVQHASCVPDGARQIEGRFRAGDQADIFQRAYADQLQRKSGGGDEAVLNAAGRADEKNLSVVSLLELIGDGERGDDVSSRASARQDCAHVVTITHEQNPPRIYADSRG